MITRKIAGDAFPFSKEIDTIVRIAEQALLTVWSSNMTGENHLRGVTINETIAKGRRGTTGNKPDIHTIKINFDGTLHGDIHKKFTCEKGSAEINGICDDGGIYVAVKPTLDSKHN